MGESESPELDIGSWRDEVHERGRMGQFPSIRYAMKSKANVCNSILLEKLIREHIPGFITMRRW